MSDYDEILMQRVDNVRGMWEFDFTKMDEYAVCEGVELIRGELRVLILPTVADGALAVDVMAFSGNELMSESTIIVRA